ncbi:MAG: type II secretion system F family protein [Terracidiphilus sp.]|jgi:tight adherence protein B
MGLIIVLVFVGAFAVVALILMAGGSTASREAKQVIASLDTALANETPEAREQIVNLRKSETFSAIPWLNKKLVNLEAGPRLRTLLNQADMKWSVGGLLTGSVLFFLIPSYLIYLRMGNIFVPLLAGLALGFVPIGWVMWKRSKRFNNFQKGLPEALDLMVSALRAGNSLIAAMGLVGRECQDPVGTEFKVCFEEQNYGLELTAALESLLKRVPLQDLRIVATAINIQKESGGNLAEVLDKTSHVIRERFRLKRQVAVHTAQGRLTGWILTFLPVVLGFALYFVNPTMMSILWTNPIGVKLMWIASGMIVVGGLIISKIVNMDV